MYKISYARDFKSCASAYSATAAYVFEVFKRINGGMRSLRRRSTADSITLLPPFVNNLYGLAVVRRVFLPGFSARGVARPAAAAA